MAQTAKGLTSLPVHCPWLCLSLVLALLCCGQGCDRSLSMLTSCPDSGLELLTVGGNVLVWESVNRNQKERTGVEICLM